MAIKNAIDNDEDFLVYSSQFVTKVVEATAYKSSHYALAELVDNSIQSCLKSNCPPKILG